MIIIIHSYEFNASFTTSLSFYATFYGSVSGLGINIIPANIIS